MVAVGIVVGIAGVFLGMYAMNLELDHPVSPQAAIALSMCAMFVVVLILRWAFRFISSIIPAHESNKSILKKQGA